MLKTLKDLSELISPSHGLIDTRDLIPLRDLKQEAIKWIKSLYEHNPDKILSFRGEDALRGWIKHFFGISEEDLK